MADVTDEWEYEYDESETEEFYITLDLSAVPEMSTSRLAAHDRPFSISGYEMLLRNKIRRSHARETEVSEKAPPTVGDMQIYGLHTQNPVVLYEHEMLSCVDTEQLNNPLRSLPFVDLLALSSTRLQATTAVLRPRDGLFEQAPDVPQPTADEVSSDAEEEVEGCRQPPTGFLAKLNQAKEERGEKTTLSVAKTSKGSQLVVEGETALETNPSEYLYSQDVGMEDISEDGVEVADEDEEGDESTSSDSSMEEF